MAFKKPSVKKTKTNLSSLRIYLRAVPKFGKTTLFRDMVLEEYNGNPEKGLLVGVGNETGYAYLDELNTTHVESWADMEELKKWLIKGKKSGEHEIELVAFDTADEIIPLAETEVCRLSQIATGKPCDSINKAFGGYGKGQDKVKEIVKKYFNDLYKAGFGITSIAHTKVKNIIEKGREDSEGYQVLTSNLPNTYESIFADIFDCVVTGVVDKDVVDGKLMGSTRKLYFRDNCFVTAGCRLPGNSVPEYMIFEGDDTAKEFIDVLKNAMKSAIKKPVSDEEFKTLQEVEKQESVEQLDTVIDEMDKKPEKSTEELINEIKQLSVDPNKKRLLLEQMKASGKKISEFSVEELEEIIKVMNN
jgi:hypothetical protein